GGGPACGRRGGTGGAAATAASGGSGRRASHVFGVEADVRLERLPAAGEVDAVGEHAEVLAEQLHRPDALPEVGRQVHDAYLGGLLGAHLAARDGGEVGEHLVGVDLDAFGTFGLGLRDGGGDVRFC